MLSTQLRYLLYFRRGDRQVNWISPFLIMHVNMQVSGKEPKAIKLHA